MGEKIARSKLIWLSKKTEEDKRATRLLPFTVSVNDNTFNCFRRVFHLTKKKIVEKLFIIVHIVVGFVKMSH